MDYSRSGPGRAGLLMWNARMRKASMGLPELTKDDDVIGHVTNSITVGELYAVADAREIIFTWATMPGERSPQNTASVSWHGGLVPRADPSPSGRSSVRHCRPPTVASRGDDRAIRTDPRDRVRFGNQCRPLPLDHRSNLRGRAVDNGHAAGEGAHRWISGRCRARRTRRSVHRTPRRLLRSRLVHVFAVYDP